MRPSRGLLFTVFAQLSGAREVAADEPTPPDAHEQIEIAGLARYTADPSVEATTVIDAAELGRLGVRTVAEALRFIRGVDVVPALAGSVVQMQGLGAQHVLILVDGHRVTGRIDGAVDLARFHTSHIESIEVVYGPTAAFYGSDALAGVIHIRTKPPRREVLVRAEAGSYGQRSARADGGLRLGDRITARLGVDWLRQDAIDLDDGAIGTSIASRDETGANARARAEWPGTLVDAMAEYALSKRASVSEGVAGAVFDTKNQTEVVTAQAKATHRALRGQWVASGNVTNYADEYLSDQRGSDALDTYQETIDTAATLQLEFSRGWGRHFVRLGAEGAYETLQTPRIEHDGARQRGVLLAQDEWKPTGSEVSVIGGVRLDADSYYGAQPTPKAALRWAPSDDLSVQLAAGMGFRAPSFKELLLEFDNTGVGYRIIGNPDLRPELSRTAQLEVSVRLSPRLNVTTGWFLNDVDDLIDFVTGETVGGIDQYTYGNVAHARTMGMDTMWQYKATHWLALRAGYSFLHAKDLTYDLPLSGRSRHRGLAAVDLEKGRWSGGVRATLYGTRVFVLADGPERRAGYALIDANVTRALPHGLTASVRVANATDAGNDDDLALAPRALFVALQWQHQRKTP